MAARLGVSLTHRDHAQSVRFITGHSRNGGLPDLDWRGLADPKTTLIVYMGGKTRDALARRLANEGLPPGTPVVAVANVSREYEQIWMGTLGELSGALDFPGNGQPVLIGIGEAFAGILRRRFPLSYDAIDRANPLRPMLGGP
jgi:uroporphyrin-III C-methyltransferase/precorrin-2 dehydrogenase/sirohydrochlorin ferrochelatase